MKKDLNALNDYLFEQLERLNDDEALKEEGLEKELKRAKAITSVSTAIVNNARLVLDARKYSDEMGVSDKEVLMLKDNN